MRYFISTLGQITNFNESWTWERLWNFRCFWAVKSTEVATTGILRKKVFLVISQNSQKNTCARKKHLYSGLRPATLLKKRLWHRRFSENFAKLLRTLFLQNSSGRLLVKVIKMMSEFLTHSSIAPDKVFFWKMN